MNFTGLGVLNAAMLIGLAGAAIPVVIHLLNRRNDPVVDWAAMQFLEFSPRERRRLNFDELLLMLARMALLALVAFALARPFWSPRPAGASATLEVPGRRLGRPPGRGARARRLEPDGPAGGRDHPPGPGDRLGPGVRQAAQGGRLGRRARGQGPRPRARRPAELRPRPRRPGPGRRPAVPRVERPPLGDRRGVPHPREDREPGPRRDRPLRRPPGVVAAGRPRLAGRCSATSADGCPTRPGSGPRRSPWRRGRTARPTARSARWNCPAPCSRRACRSR